METFAPDPAPFVPTLWSRSIASTILVVDDDPNVLDTLRSLLIEEDLTVRTARDASQALDRLRRSPVALVVCDAALPAGNGLTLVEEMRLRGDDTPVLLTCGAAAADVPLGSRVLHKPLDHDAFLDAVRESLKQARYSHY